MAVVNVVFTLLREVLLCVGFLWAREGDICVTEASS